MSNKHQSNKTAEERSETDFESFDEEKGRSRLAREAKIGLAVIFVLLVVFALVLYNRFTSADEDSGASAGAASSKTEAGEAPAWTGSDPGGFATSTSQPTVLAAKPGSSEADPTNLRSVPGTPSSLDSWGVVAEDHEPEEGRASMTIPSAPPPLVPRLVPAKPADRYAGYRSTQTADGPATTWQSGGSYRGSSADDDQPYDPFARPSTQAASDDGQAGAAVVQELAGRQWSSTDASMARPPGPEQASDPDQSWSQQQNRLRGQTTVAGPKANTETLPYSGGSGYAYQASESPQTSVAQAPVPTPAVGPHSTFRTASQPSDATRQVDLSGASPGQSDLAQQYQSDRLSTAGHRPQVGRTGQRWSSGASVAQSDPTEPALARQSPHLGGLGGQYADVGSAASSDGTYVVQPNDNYWVISAKLYGTGAYFRALAYHNRAKVPDQDRLQLGEEILAPDAAELEKAYPDLCPKPAHRTAAERRTVLGSTPTLLGGGRVYVVQEGDNLFDIARYELGKATRWTEIVDLNKELLGPNLNDLNYLTPGMKLVLPDGQPASNVTQRPDSLYQR